MNFKLILFAILAVVFLLIVAVVCGYFMPTVWHAEQSIVIQAPAASVHALVDSPARWPEWFPWNAAKDPNIRYTFHGPQSGVGASFEWSSEKLAHGTLTISESDPKTGVKYGLVLSGFERPVQGEIALVEANGATTVSYREGGELGTNPIARLMRGVVEGSLELQLGLALERLKAIAEGRPPPVEPPTKY